MESAASRLVDEFRAEASARGLELPAELTIGGIFGDLEGWPGDGGDVDDMVARADRDPAFELIGYSRWVVFARIRGEIRCYAAPFPEGTRDWWWDGSDPARVAAIEAEPDVSELAILPTVADAVTLAADYLGGKPLREIGVRRLPPPWGSSAPEPAADGR